MKKLLLFCLVHLLCTAVLAQQPLVNAHAHNDYEQDRPLLEALENGFISVEADIHAIDGELYVVHDRPSDLATIPTLEQLYLRPLEQRITENRGEVYPGYDGFFYLMIDIKTEAEDTYVLLRQVLEDYTGIISVVSGDQEEKQRPVKVFLSGNRPIETVLRDPKKFVGLDGRPADLEKNYPPAIMPVISDNYRRFLSSRDPKTIDDKELAHLKQTIAEAHAQGKLLRLWAIPDNPEMWEFLLSIGVDLINTDRLPELRMFLEERGR